MCKFWNKYFLNLPKGRTDELSSPKIVPASLLEVMQSPFPMEEKLLESAAKSNATDKNAVKN